jgi:RNA polymerase sigma-70 factor (ECF subfamily)
VNDSESRDDRAHLLRDRGARTLFVRASYAELFRWFCRLTGSPDRAADLTQETFSAFWVSLDRIRSDVSPRTWLYAIGRNLWRKQVRDQGNPRHELPELVVDGSPSPERIAQDQEFREAAERAVIELPDDLREAFTLRFWHEFEYDEIGAIQGVAPGVARWRFFAARRRLQEKLAAWNPERDRTEEDQHVR